jgi:hypothetical protein
MATGTAAKSSTENTSTLTTSIVNYLIVASSTPSFCDQFINCGCMMHISGPRLIIITYTEYPPNTKKEKRFNGVTLFASRYGSVRLSCQLPDGQTETIILQEVVHFPGWFNLISQSQIMDKDINVELVNHYSLNLYNHHCKLIATAPQVDGLFILNRALESTEYTDINDTCLLVLKTTGHASRPNAEKRML